MDRRHYQPEIRAKVRGIILHTVAHEGGAKDVLKRFAEEKVKTPGGDKPTMAFVTNQMHRLGYGMLGNQLPHRRKKYVRRRRIDPKALKTTKPIPRQGNGGFTVSKSILQAVLTDTGLTDTQKIKILLTYANC